MAAQAWSDKTPLPPVVKVELIGEVYVKHRERCEENAV